MNRDKELWKLPKAERVARERKMAWCRDTIASQERHILNLEEQVRHAKHIIRQAKEQLEVLVSFKLN